MTWKRRKFLVLSGLSGLGVVGLARFWHSVRAQPNQIPPDPNPLLLRFVAVADVGTGAGGQYAVANAMARYYRQNPFKTVVLAGDNIYLSGEIEKVSAVFEKPYKPLLSQGVKFYAALGNHDIRTNNGDDEVRYPGFNMKGRYYTFTQGPVQFFALETNTIEEDKQQQKWLETSLSQSQAPWKIVFGHHQLYSSGVYGVGHRRLKVLAPLFKKYGVQLYINGHEHNYERTQPIDGTTYLVCGGGAGLRPVESSSWTAKSASVLSFAALEVYRDRITVYGIDSDSQVFDEGTIPV